MGISGYVTGEYNERWRNNTVVEGLADDMNKREAEVYIRYVHAIWWNTGGK